MLKKKRKLRWEKKPKIELFKINHLYLANFSIAESIIFNFVEYFSISSANLSTSISLLSCNSFNSFIVLTTPAFLSISLSISSIVFQIPGGHLADKIGKKRALIISELFGLGYFSLLILAFMLWSTGFGLFLIPLLSIGAILRGICASTFISAQQMIITELDETRKAESYGILGFLQGIGYLPTGIIGALLIESVSYLAPFIITFIGILFEIWILSKFFHE